MQSQGEIQLTDKRLVRVIGTGHFDEFSLDELVANTAVRRWREGHVICPGQFVFGLLFRLRHNRISGCRLGTPT